MAPAMNTLDARKAIKRCDIGTHKWLPEDDIIKCSCNWTPGQSTCWSRAERKGCEDVFCPNSVITGDCSSSYLLLVNSWQYPQLLFANSCCFQITSFFSSSSAWRNSCLNPLPQPFRPSPPGLSKCHSWPSTENICNLLNFSFSLLFLNTRG